MKSKKVFCDLLVAGAGISGIAAAVAASRKGISTALIEKNDFLGGLAVDCRHRYICGLYPKNTGIAGEIISTLKKLNPQNRFTTLGKLPVFHCRPQDLKSTLHKLIAQEKHLRVFYHSQINRVKRRGAFITSLQAQGKSGRLNFAPKAVIDATGSGSVIKLSKAKYRLAPLKTRPLAGFTFEITGIKDQNSLLPIKIPYLLASAAKQKKLPAYLKFTNFYYAQDRKSGTIKINLPASNRFRGSAVTKHYCRLVYSLLRKNLPEFKNSRISHISAMVHEREGLRLLGKHILTEKEILGGRKFTSAAARGYWPIEFWSQKLGQKISYLKPRQFYEIPLSCLQSVNVHNLMATGKCLSATSLALASTRVMGTCIYLGEAAGNQAEKLIEQ
jgi:hypothetical protein